MQGLLAFQRYFEFSGRSARAEYWQFMGLYVLAATIAYVLDLAFSGPYATPTLTAIVVLICIVPAYAAAVRRLHDRGRSGRWVVAQLIAAAAAGVLITAFERSRYTAAGDVLQIAARIASIANVSIGLYLFVEVLRRSEAGTNAYGPDPLTNPVDAPTLAAVGQLARNAASTTSRTGAPRLQSPTGDPLEQIERLAKLRDAGMLTDEEFSTQKAAYLSRL